MLYQKEIQLPVGEMVPSTDSQIQDVIENMVARFKAVVTGKYNKDRDSTPHLTPQSYSIAHLPTTSATNEDNVERRSLNYAANEQYTTTFGQALEEDISKGSKSNAELSPKSRKMDDCTTSASKKHSTEYQQIMGKFASTCSKNEDEIPEVLTTVPEMTLDELTEKQPISSLIKNLNDKDQMPGVSWDLRHMSEREKGDTGLNPEEAAGLDNVQCVTDVLVDLQTKSSSVLTENKTFVCTSLTENQDANARRLKNTEDQHCKWLLNQRSHTLARVEVHSQTDVSIALSETKVKEQPRLSDSECREAPSEYILKDPQYEDISDDEEMSQWPTSLPACYEDISEDENENEGYGQVQGQNKTEVISDEELMPKKHVSPETSLDIAQHLGAQTNHCISHSHSSVLKDEYETDDQMDDEWIVIPIIMSDIRFEPEDDDQGSPEKVVSHCASLSPVSPSPSPVPSSASSQMPVFDTYDKFKQTHHVENIQMISGDNTPEHELDYEGEPHTLLSRRQLYSEPEDSCDTEDSCDYSSGSERNYMTPVARQYLPPEGDESVSEKEDEDDEVEKLKKDKARSTIQRLRQMFAGRFVAKHDQHKTNGQQVSEEDVIVLDSDTESDQKCKKKAKRKSSFSLGFDNCGDAECSQQKRHSPETVDSPCGTVEEKFQRKRLPSANSPAPQHQSKLTDTQSEEVMQDSCSESDIILVSDTEDENDQNGKQEGNNKSGLLFETKGSEHVQHDRQKISGKESEIILVSDTEDENDLDGKEEEIDKSGQLAVGKSSSEHVQHKTNRQTMSEERRNTKRIWSSKSEDSGDALSATQNRPSSATVDRLGGTANKKPKKPRRSSEDLQNKQPQCVDKEADSTLGPNPVISRLVVQKSSQPTENLKLVKESEVHTRAIDETPAAKSPTRIRGNADSCEKNIQNLCRNKNIKQLANGRRHSIKNNSQANVAKPCLVSRQLSLPCQGSPVNSDGRLSSTSGQIPEARQSSASSSGLSQSGKTSTQPKSIPRRRLSSTKPLLPHSYSSPSTSDHPRTPTKGPSSSATSQSSARHRVVELWGNNYYPTRRDRTPNFDSRSEARPAPRTTNNDSWNEAKPGPSRCNRAPKQRHTSHESAPHLMKKTKFDAIQLTKARNRDVSRKRASSVGDGYKWSEKPAMAKSRKGSGR